MNTGRIVETEGGPGERVKKDEKRDDGQDKNRK